MYTLQSNTVLLPDETLDELDAALKSIDIRRPATYADTWGDHDLRIAVKRLTSNWEGDALITNSATQALFLSLEHLVGRRKTLALQVPSYFGVLRQAKDLGLDISPWETVDDLERLKHFDAVLLTSNLTPPHGLSFSADDKERIADAANAQQAWVIEDNAYEALWFKEAPKPVPSNPDKTIRIGSLSKIVSPDFRVGFIRASTDNLNRIRSHKITQELSTLGLVQKAAQAGITEQALERWRRTLEERAGVMQQSLRDNFNIQAVLPEGGPYMALPLPQGVEVAVLVAECKKNGLSIDSNGHQYPDGKDRPYIRLHYGGIKREDIPQAMQLLKGSFQAVLEKKAAPELSK